MVAAPTTFDDTLLVAHTPVVDDDGPAAADTGTGAHDVVAQAQPEPRPQITLSSYTLQTHTSPAEWTLASSYSRLSPRWGAPSEINALHGRTHSRHGQTLLQLAVVAFPSPPGVQVFTLEREAAAPPSQSPTRTLKLLRTMGGPDRALAQRCPGRHELGELSATVVQHNLRHMAAIGSRALQVFALPSFGTPAADPLQSMSLSLVAHIPVCAWMPAGRAASRGRALCIFLEQQSGRVWCIAAGRRDNAIHFVDLEQPPASGGEGQWGEGGMGGGGCVWHGERVVVSPSASFARFRCAAEASDTAAVRRRLRCVLGTAWSVCVTAIACPHTPAAALFFQTSRARRRAWRRPHWTRARSWSLIPLRCTRSDRYRAGPLRCCPFCTWPRSLFLSSRYACGPHAASRH